MKQPEVVVGVFIDSSANLTRWCNNLQDLLQRLPKHTWTFTPLSSRFNPVSDGPRSFVLLFSAISASD